MTKYAVEFSLEGGAHIEANSPEEAKEKISTLLFGWRGKGLFFQDHLEIEVNTISTETLGISEDWI